MKLDLAEVAGGTRLRLRVRAGARRNAILGVHAGALKLSVGTAPERGRANHAVRELLADALGVAASTISLEAGPTSPDKVVLVPLPADTIRERLERG